MGSTVGLSARVRRALRAGRPGREQLPWNQQVALSRRTAYTGPVTIEDVCVVTGRERRIDHLTRDNYSYRESNASIRSRCPTFQTTDFQRHPALPVSPLWPPHVVDHAGGLAAIGETPVAAGDSSHPSTIEIPRDVAPVARIA